MSGEEWRWVEGYHHYEVSNFGRVRSVSSGTPRLIKLTKTKKGYVRVELYKSGHPKRKFVHRLVCNAFNEARCAEHMVVAHWDGDPGNNIASNLRWATHAENSADMIRHGRSCKGRRPA